MKTIEASDFVTPAELTISAYNRQGLPLSPVVCAIYNLKNDIRVDHPNAIFHPSKIEPLDGGKRVVVTASIPEPSDHFGEGI